MPETGVGDTGEESPAMRAFLAERGAAVLFRAIETIETCSDAELPGQAHRLAGTLGIFGFDAASVEMRSLQRAAESDTGSGSALSEHRTRTLGLLRATATGDREQGAR
jgi:hypothetical protein